MAVSANTKAIFEYLKAHPTEDVTAADLAEILGSDVKKINGGFTGGIQRKDLGYREEVEVELADGSHQKVKLLKLNDAGMALDDLENYKKPEDAE